MHGRLKVRTTEEQKALKAQENAKKLAAYRAAMESILMKRKAGELDDEILQITAKLLTRNPDIYTLWNIRKETIQKIKEERPADLDCYVAQELSLTEQCIKANPKSYNSWFQRGWILDYGSKIDYNYELHLCSKCLDLDDRNFHCWDYRRIIVSKSGNSQENELAFSTERIEKNFSNYSSWHYRSELLPRIFPSPAGEALLDGQKLADECTYVQNALFTDPNDQSAWFYQRWLLFKGEEERSDETKEAMLSLLKKELEACQQLHDLEPENKWVVLQICEMLRRVNSKERAEILELVEKLKEIDPLRKGYYEYYGAKLKAS